METKRDKTGNSHINHIYLLSIYEDHVLFGGQITQQGTETKFQWMHVKINKCKNKKASVI